MKVQIELDEKTLRKLVLDYVLEKMGSVAIDEKDIYIEVKSKQNYRSEWESAAFRARIEKVS